MHRIKEKGVLRMGRAAELKGLPSAAESEDGSICSFEEMSGQERAQLQKRLTENLEKRMGCYYAQHLQEWERFLKR